MSRKTWKDLKEFVDSLSPEQLQAEVLFQDDYDNLMPVEFYTSEDEGPSSEDWKTEVKPYMPFLGL